MKAKRFKNYQYVRDRLKDEIPWVRVEDFKELNLKRPVGLINGAFDILHPSHMRLIFHARDKAATLVCALDSDEKVNKSKGEGRPILGWVDRAVALNYMPIDYIVEINTKEDMENLMIVLSPDVRVQGYEYKNIPSRFPNIPKIYVRDSGVHTSMIIERCKLA